MDPSSVRTVGELKASGWHSKSVRDEIRDNLVRAIQSGASTAERWPGILGYEQTVIPAIENALLSRHDFILLGLRGQAKTRMLRMLVRYLDPLVPALDGCPLNDDPLAPLTGSAKAILAKHGDDAPIRWVAREDRYHEKLATPDVTIADLLGDVDPIKAATKGVSLDDEEALHYGLIPRSNRGIFAVNELPDLSPRIQVGLFNILEERDVQLRGFPVRIPLDVVLVFSANPEDYTNRGSIITPLRDRIASQILTHYPASLDVARTITSGEAYQERSGVEIHIPDFVRDAVEETAIRARTSEFVDQASGVSVRLTIALLENAISNAERRALMAGHASETVRVADLFAAQSAVTGKIELVFEGEREGPAVVAERLLGQGVAAVFQRVFPAPYNPGRRGAESEPEDVYKPIVDWFAQGKTIAVSDEIDHAEALREIPSLEELVRTSMSASGYALEERDVGPACELVLEGLHQASLLSKDRSLDGVTYGDMLKRMFAGFED
ncbi:MAG: magnesium chelatase [Planctomycetota bacterium]|nr:magnesium chelatase [Planctomycetota bacterium]